MSDRFGKLIATAVADRELVVNQRMIWEEPHGPLTHPHHLLEFASLPELPAEHDIVADFAASMLNSRLKMRDGLLRLFSGLKNTRQQALVAIKPGRVMMHVGLQDWASEIDMRKLTLAEITLLGTYTYSMADLRATVAALDRGVFGDLSWVARRPLADGAQAFQDLHHGRLASAKVVLEPAG